MSSSASSSSDPINLPYTTIQHDFQSVISDVDNVLVENEDVWLSCYKENEPSVHGKVKVQLGETSRKVELVPRGGVGLKLSEGTGGSYIAECASLGIPPTPLRAPKYTIRDEEETKKPKQISAFAIAPDLSQVALGYMDGAIRRLPLDLPGSSSTTDPPATPITYTPHLSGTSITVLRYFPSSRVLLSAGTDFTIHILDASPAPQTKLSPARTLKGHIRSVTDLAIVGRGRHVLSCARDGTVRVWDVSKGEQTKLLGSKGYDAINAMVLGSSSSSVETSEDVGLEGKVVFLALQSGAIECLDLSTATSLFHQNANSGPLVSIAYDQQSSLLAAGSTNGAVTLLDVRSPSSPLCAFKRNGASIIGLGFVLPREEREEDTKSHSKLVIATADGLPFVAKVRPDGPEVDAELVAGGDCEPCRALNVLSNVQIAIAGEEGVVRIY